MGGFFLRSFDARLLPSYDGCLVVYGGCFGLTQLPLFLRQAPFPSRTHPPIHFPHALVLHSTISTFFITARGRNHSCTIASFQTHTHTIQSFHAHYAMNARSHSLNAPFLQAYIYNPPTTSIKKSQHLIELILEILHCIHLITKTYPPKRKTPQFARNTRPYRYFLPLQ